MQARECLNYRLKYCWPKFICCIRQLNELKREIKKKLGNQSKISGDMQSRVYGGLSPLKQSSKPPKLKHEAL